jgi:Protein of unknown function (DUF1565)
VKRQLGILSVALLVVAGFAPMSQASGRPSALRVCSNGPFRTIQSAVDAARPGDTVRICPGTYVEGSGAQGSNALTITKDLTLTGPGADQVRIEAQHGAQLAESNPDIHSGKGVLVAVIGANVDISGVTVDANGADATAGVVYVDSQGSISRARVTGVDVDESANGYTVPGGFRSNAFGFGIAHVGGSRALTVDHNARGPLQRGRRRGRGRREYSRADE